MKKMFKRIDLKLCKQDLSSSVDYHMADGTIIHVTYDEYGNVKVGREFLEWCLAHVNENIKNENHLKEGEKF